jgi:hypothetical protein
MPEGAHRAAIEQLHYTWAPRGAEGINQFQIAAISAGLKQPPLVSLLPDLRRLCRYDHPPGGGDGPASFGWLDLHQHRVAFLRVAVPGVGERSGSFAAHLLVGDAASLPEAEIASSFGAGFWWTGLTDEELEGIADGKQDFELPPVDWSEALETRVEPAPDAVEPAGALARELLSLADGERLAVLDDGSWFGPALRVLGRRLPAALAGVSLSTYEGTPGFPFAVVGTPARPSGVRVCELPADSGLDADGGATARQLLDDRPESDLLRSAIGRPAGPGPGRSGGSRWDAARTLVALASGTAADPGPVAALADPIVIAYLAHSEAGRERLAEAATRGSPQPLAALARARERISPAHFDDLCLAIGRQFGASGDLRGCAGVLAALPPGSRERLEEELLRIALRPETGDTAIGSEDSVALVRIAAARGLETQRCRPLLRRAARYLGACAEDLTVPDSALVAMLPVALAEGGAEAELCRALRRRPRLLTVASPGIDEQERWLALARRLPSRQLGEALPALLAGLTQRQHRELSMLVERVPGNTGRQALIAAGDLFDRGSLPAVLAELCEGWAAVALADGEVEVGRRLLALGSSRDSQLAAGLLVGPRASTAARVRAAYRVGEIRDPTLRTKIFETAVDGALRELRHPDDAKLVWTLLVSSYPQEDDEALLARLLRHAMRTPPASGQATLLAWLGASLLPARPELRKRNGQPKNRTCAELTATLAQRMSQSEIDRMEPFLETGDHRTARWWKGLVADSRKALDRRGR